MVTLAQIQMRNYKHQVFWYNVLSGNSIGHNLVLTSIGESHGLAVGAILDGCPAGLQLDESDIQYMLDLRRPGQSAITTQRKETDRVEIISGVFRGHTTGAPITMMIWNEDQKSKDYEDLRTKLRPGHSDFTAMVKYNRFNDHRGGGRFSGRLTATHVMGGAIARKLLKSTLGIDTHSFVTQVGKNKIAKKPFKILSQVIYKNDVRCPDAQSARKMKEAILAAKRDGDSLGGVIESVTSGMPVGMGEPIFNSLESDLSSAMFSIPSVKGVEFGSGFEGSSMLGSENNDLFVMDDGKIVTATNNAGGILGGISNGMPITMRVAFKPASSISKKQKTVDIKTKKETVLQVAGRHDPCVVPRAPPVVDSLVSLVLADHAILSGLIGRVL